MGLILSTLTAAGSTLRDQWKEYFYCEAIPNNILAVKGQKKENGVNRGSDNIISDGSVIAVADGQTMLIVEQGKVVEICSEPGEYVYDSKTEPSVFTGGLSESVKNAFATFGKRFTFGGQTANDQRVYYFNTKEITGIKYGTPNPIPFRIVDKNIGLDMDSSVRCFGEYSIRIIDPVLFYTNVCANFTSEFTVAEIEGQLKTELLTALQPAFAKIGDTGVRFSSLPAHTTELADILNEVLSAKWLNLRGIKIVSFGISSITGNEEDEKTIKELQRDSTLRDQNMAAARLVGAQAQAMQDAANNASGAMNGFIGMNMAQNVGGTTAGQLYAMGAQNQASTQPQAGSNTWNCPQCGTVNTGNFCNNCGTKKPSASWTCPQCGTVNEGNFCNNCGTKRP